MNEYNISDDMIDQLVDGELSRDDVERLLKRFDGDDGGWKRCALAFMEAQAFRECFLSLQPTERSKTSTRGTNHVPSAASAKPFSAYGYWSLALTTVAALLLAFVAGAITSASFREAHTDAITNIDHPHSTTADSQPNTREVVGMVINDSVTDQRFAIPVDELPEYESVDDIDQSAFLTQITAPEQVQQALDQLGLELQQSEDFRPYRLQDGRQVIVPIQRVNIVPVADRWYQ